MHIIVLPDRNLEGRSSRPKSFFFPSRERKGSGLRALTSSSLQFCGGGGSVSMRYVFAKMATVLRLCLKHLWPNRWHVLGYISRPSINETSTLFGGFVTFRTFNNRRWITRNGGFLTCKTEIRDKNSIPSDQNILWFEITVNTAIRWGTVPCRRRDRSSSLPTCLLSQLLKRDEPSEG